MVDELSSVGQGLVMPALNVKIKELFGFDFAELLEDMGRTKKRSAKKLPAKRKAAKKRQPKKISRG
jgi:hypothetical protein